MVLIAVFVPLAFIEGAIGRLFSEFAITMAAAVAFSSLVALSLSPMLSSKILQPTSNRTKFNIAVDEGFEKLKARYREALARALVTEPPVPADGLVIAALGLFIVIPSEYAPREDRGIFFVIVNGPEGASFNYIQDYMNEIEDRLMPLVESGEINRLLVRAPRSFGNLSSFNILHSRHRAGRLERSPLGMGDHGRCSGARRRSSGCHSLADDAAGLRARRGQARAVRHRRRLL